MSLKPGVTLLDVEKYITQNHEFCVDFLREKDYSHYNYHYYKGARDLLENLLDFFGNTNKD